ncbi:MAG: hypothetical protein WCG26_13730 [Chloroflexales bacterium]
MNTLIIIGLVATVILTAVGRMVTPQAQPPQIIYVQAAPTETAGAGCLPLIMLIAVILFAISFS